MNGAWRRKVETCKEGPTGAKIYTYKYTIYTKNTPMLNTNRYSTQKPSESKHDMLPECRINILFTTIFLKKCPSDLNTLLDVTATVLTKGVDEMRVPVSEMKACRCIFSS